MLCFGVVVLFCAVWCGSVVFGSVRFRSVQFCVMFMFMFHV